MDIVNYKGSTKNKTGWFLCPAKESFGRLRSKWDELNTQLYQSHPLFDSRFIAPLIKFFSGEKTFLASYIGQDRIEGMTLVTPRRPGIWTSFLPSQQQVAPVLFTPEVYLRIDELFSVLPGMSLSLEWLCQDPLYSPCFSTAPWTNIENSRHATTTSISLEGMFADYWSDRSKNLRRNVKRYFHRLENDNIVTKLNVVANQSSLADALAVYGNMESGGWKGQTGTAIHSNNLQGKFYLEVLKRFGSKNKALVYQLFFNDELAASRLCIANDFMLVILKTTYNENCSKYAPGWLLLRLMLEREFGRQQFKTIEFYTNASREQLGWATQSRRIEHVTIYRSEMHLATLSLLRKAKKLLYRYTASKATTKNS